jgi:transcriptional regulator with GAF, ATPase, and Fis domain
VPVKAWVTVRDWEGPPSRADVLGALRLAGVADVGAEPAAAPQGVVLVGGMSPRLVESLQELSLGGNRPVLAVAAKSSDLKGGASWQLLAAGASDVVAWDASLHPADDIAARLERWWSVDQLEQSAVVRDSLVGESPAWHSTLRQVIEVARFTSSPVLVTGESGTGKELVARVIHALDPRPDRGDFVVLDCTTVVPTLSGSEFFGHEKGAFTGAIAAREGAFAMADQGTLFLDEISELPLQLQAELLRVIQEGMYKRVGSNTWRRTTFRLVAATNRDLAHAESMGQFRRDLYYRLAGWSFRLPSLRERRSDIPLLARHFLRALHPSGALADLEPTVEELLVRRDYPGNIRDLRQLVSRIAGRHVGLGPITVGDVPPDDRPTPPTEVRADAEFENAIRKMIERGLTLKDISQLAGDTAVQIAVSAELWNLQRAATRLGVTSRALQLRRVAGRGLPTRSGSNGPLS